MADNVAITAGAGTSIATDDVGGVHYQIVKNAYGPADTATLVSNTAPMPVEQQRDISRFTRHFILDAWTAAPVAEALQNVVQWYANAAVTATTTPAVVPVGRVLRLHGARIETKSLATVGSALMRIRANTAGTALVTSPLVASIGAGSISGTGTTAMTGALDSAEVQWPDGIEFPAGTGLGFTLAGYGPTGTLTLQGVTRFEVWGIEYAV